MENLKKINPLLAILLLLAVLNILVWNIDAQQGDKIKVAFLNVGQGDAIYIETANGNQIIVDGGPDRSILNELSKVMPFYDRSIDALIVSNPDKDHFAGFIDVLKKYKIGAVFVPGTVNDSQVYEVFLREVRAREIPIIQARRGMRLVLEKNSHIEILFPDRDVSEWKTNEGSIVAKLVYKKFSVLLTGDSVRGIERYLGTIAPEKIKSSVLKVAHHGSDTSTSEDFVRAVSPNLAIVSAGLSNKYGHPHPSTVSLLSKLKIPILVTADDGTIVLESEGENFSRVR